jgi:hypothetical protein
MYRNLLAGFTVKRSDLIEALGDPAAHFEDWDFIGGKESGEPDSEDVAFLMALTTCCSDEAGELLIEKFKQAMVESVVGWDVCS